MTEIAEAINNLTSVISSINGTILIIGVLYFFCKFVMRQK